MPLFMDLNLMIMDMLDAQRGLIRLSKTSENVKGGPVILIVNSTGDERCHHQRILSPDSTAMSLCQSAF